MQVANVDTTRKQQAQQPAFHKVLKWSGQSYSRLRRVSS